MATDNEILIAGQGTFILNNTTEFTGNFDAIVVLEDTVFNSIKIAGNDVKTSYIGTPATAVKAGAIIRPTSAQKFSGVKLTSGSVTIVL
jgi:hypothetical protein